MPVTPADIARVHRLEAEVEGSGAPANTFVNPE
jgi:hypothetical protein